jgi:hypothetical protein
LRNEKIEQAKKFFLKKKKKPLHFSGQISKGSPKTKTILKAREKPKICVQTSFFFHLK